MRLGVSAALVDGRLVPGDVSVVDRRIDRVGLPAAQRPGGLAAPGLVDLQVNGYAGVDFLTSDARGWREAARQLARDGVTAFVANLITSPPQMLDAALGVARKVVSRTPDDAARALGAHLEGPFLAPSRAGTHPPEHLLLPDETLLQRARSAGPVLGLTLAPELPGALRLIEISSRAGLVVSLGHSEATAAEAHAGFDAGARSVTHVFNAMTGLTSRAPGLAGVALTRPHVTVQLICDGVHLARETASLVMAAARDRFVLVTDALSAAHAADGDYRLGTVAITAVGGDARRPDGGLAGSVLSLAEAVRGAVDAGARVEDALAAATTRPLDLLGPAGSSSGRLRPGDHADVVVLDDALAVTRTLLGGRAVD